MPKDVLRIGDVITVFDLRPCEVRVPSQTRYLGKRKKERKTPEANPRNLLEQLPDIASTQ